MRNLKHSFLFVVLLSFVSLLMAQVPQDFTFQAVVRDAQGHLLKNQAVGIRCSILQGAGGTAVYVETHSATTNANGLFSIVIGQGSIVSGRLADVLWGSADFHLKTDIDPQGGTAYLLTSEYPFTSVPYALYAASADSSKFARNAAMAQAAQSAAHTSRADTAQYAFTLIGGLAEQQIIWLSNDTLYLTGGSFVKLPAPSSGSTFSGSFSDLTNVPPIFSGDYNDLTNRPTLFSGDYNDLSNRPTPFSGDYNDLSNRPTIPTLPTALSAFTNDMGFITSCTESQVLSLSHDTLFLTGGSFVKLPSSTGGSGSDTIHTHVYDTTRTIVFDTLRTYAFDTLRTLVRDTAYVRDSVQCCMDSATLAQMIDSVMAARTHRLDSLIAVVSQVLDSLRSSGSTPVTPPSPPTPPSAAYLSVNQSACVSLAWRGRTYTASGTYTDTVPIAAAGGADSIYVLHLTIKPAYATDSSARIDSNEVPFLWYGQSFSSSITHSHTLIASNGCDSVVTLHLVVGDEGVLPGLFAVSAVKKVRFSQGNLQYQPSTATWRFALRQYDFVGGYSNSSPAGNFGNVYKADGVTRCKNNSPRDTTTSWLDLFGWGTSGWNSGASAYMPYATNGPTTSYYVGGTNTNDLTGDYVQADWGVHNPIANGGNAAGLWRTLSESEWRYLYNERPGAVSKRGQATVEGVYGVVLLPDDWTLPSGCTFSSTYTGTGYATGYNSNTYNASKWEAMEAAGAVFLPSAGYRGNGTGSGDNYFRATGYHARYWSSTHGTDIKNAMAFTFYEKYIGMTDLSRSIGCSVRLIFIE